MESTSGSPAPRTSYQVWTPLTLAYIHTSRGFLIDTGGSLQTHRTVEELEERIAKKRGRAPHV
jgi:hypothetical protein